MDYGRLEPRELIRERHALVQRLGELEEELNRRRQQDRHVIKKAEMEWDEGGWGIGMRPRGAPFRMVRLVNPELGFNAHNIMSFIMEIPPGSSEGAYHTHGEAHKYYLSGRGIEIIGDKRYEVEAGDVCFVPAFTWHGTQNPGPEPLRFLAVVQGVGTPLLEPIIFRIREDMKDSR